MNAMKTISTTTSVTVRPARAALCLSLMLAQTSFTPFANASAVPKLKTDDTSLPCDATPNFTFGLSSKGFRPAW